MACEFHRASLSRQKNISGSLQDKPGKSPGALAVSVIVDELDSAITRSLKRLEIEGVSQEIAWQAMHDAVEAIQLCFVLVEEECAPPRKIKPNHV
jgi:hypothetical protein